MIESTCNSPLFPILNFDLSFCRNALTADGLAVYHADWTFKNVSYLCPLTADAISSESSARMKLKVMGRAEKYAKRGVTVYHDMRDWTRMSNHICSTATVCPQTLRNTEDSGVYFLPFSTMTDEYRRKCKSAHCVTLMWRCGGPSCHGNSEGMNACVFRAPGLNKKYVSGSRI